MNLDFLVLLPTIIVITIAILTKRVLLSLFLGVLSAGLISTKFKIFETIKVIFYRLLEQTSITEIIKKSGDYDKAYIICFVILLGILIEILTHTGSLQIYTKKLIKILKNKKQAQILGLSISPIFFLDDYLNALMNGSIMRPITDYFKIPRAKLAYLINSIGSSQALLFPATSWIGISLTQFEAAGVGSPGLFNFDPYYLYICTIPFLIFPILSIFSAWYIILRKISFGKMKTFETIAEKTGNLFGGNEPLDKKTEEKQATNSSLMDIITPIASFFLTFIISMLYTGNFRLFGGNNTLLKTFMRANSMLSLFLASLVAVTIASINLLRKKQGSIKNLSSLYLKGLSLMKGAIILLILAGALSYQLRLDLNTGAYLTKLLSTSLSINILPAIIFLISTLTCASTGSSWGTIMLLMPLTFPLLSSFATMAHLTATNIIFFIAPTLGALLSGSVAGSQISPITDATIISSLSARAYLLNHNQTQTSYAMPAIIGTISAFLTVGMLTQKSLAIKMLLPIFVGILITIAILQIRQWIANKK